MENWSSSSEVSGRKITKFVHDVADSSPCHLLKTAFPIARGTLLWQPILGLNWRNSLATTVHMYMGRVELIM